MHKQQEKQNFKDFEERNGENRVMGVVKIASIFRNTMRGVFLNLSPLNIYNLIAAFLLLSCRREPNAELLG